MKNAFGARMKAEGGKTKFFNGLSLAFKITVVLPFVFKLFFSDK
jgi:hypothetical protein